MIALGIFLHSVGGFAAGSFYIPFKKVRNWAWESYWLVNGILSWIIMPWIIALLTVPGLISILREASKSSIFWSYLFGLLWGIGGLTFGLSMRYLGMSLGYAIALGFCAAFGTIIPPIYFGTFGDLITCASGLTALGGVLVCLAGIAICGWAGMSKEKELPDEKKKETISMEKPSGEGKRILVVEDEERVLEFTINGLDRSGYVVFAAANAEEAKKIFKKEKGNFHLVLSDVVLPDESGIELVEEFISQKPDIAVLLSSGYTDHKSRWPVIQKRGFHFLEKPYTLNDLLCVVQDLAA